MNDVVTPKKRGRGRPKKSEIEAKKPGNRGAVGRPKGDAAILNEYKARMLASPKSTLVLEKIFDAALDDNHKGQTAAWKLVADRIAPLGLFEQELKTAKNSGSIQININTVGTADVVPSDEPLEADFSEVKE